MAHLKPGDEVTLISPVDWKDYTPKARKFWHRGPPRIQGPAFGEVYRITDVSLSGEVYKVTDVGLSGTASSFVVIKLEGFGHRWWSSLMFRKVIKGKQEQKQSIRSLLFGKPSTFEEPKKTEEPARAKEKV